jgi:RNA polymerase sigma factor (sigma-70 family)
VHWSVLAHGAAAHTRSGSVIGEDFPTVLTAAQSGDPGAIETIYRDVAPLVLGYLRSNGARDVEDTSSEVFLSMVTRLASFRGDEHQFRSWLLTITYRRMVDDLRRRGRRPEDPLPAEEIGDRVALLGDGESEAMARLRSRGVLEALDGLTDDQRAALMLRVLADLPVREISEILGKPETAVKALLRRAFAGLERLLTREESDDLV